MADPGRIPDAVEEILRYEGSTQLMARTLTRPVELHGERMPEGAKVLLLLGSANRDERVWDRPDEFDIDRDVVGAARRASATASTCASAPRSPGSRCA